MILKNLQVCQDIIQKGKLIKEKETKFVKASVASSSPQDTKEAEKEESRGKKNMKKLKVLVKHRSLIL